jgi:lysophospholipase L1-like esterase
VKPPVKQDKRGTPATCRVKKFLLRILLVVMSVTFTLVLLEIGFRVYYCWKSPQRYLTLDKPLGWRNTGNLDFVRERKDAAGQPYRCAVQVDANGFREYGDAGQTSRPKMLVLGDSFTQAYEVSNEHTYYHRLKSALDVEMFAYGCGGYGTLQEYLVLDQCVDSIQPNVLVLQLCHNDFINNCYELELKTPWHNNGMRRPYLQEDGTIIYALPKTDLPALRSFGHKHSRLVHFVFLRLDRIQLKRQLASAKPEPDVATQWETNSIYRRSVAITDRLFGMIRRRVPRDTMIYAFSVDNLPPYLDEFKRLASENGFIFIGDAAEALHQAEQNGQTIRAADKTHLNVLGHQILARVLAERLSQAR